MAWKIPAPDAGSLACRAVVVRLVAVADVKLFSRSDDRMRYLFLAA
ncbi:hypothetical protein R3134_005010 [Salmonella enterica]|nr:hypothetical protein [Salmonella enterica]